MNTSIVQRLAEPPVASFFVDLVMQTDEARRQFEAHPVALEAVANGLSVERYRHLLLELYQVVWNFNPVCAAAASRVTDEHSQVRYFLYEHMHEESGHEQWVANDLRAVGVSPAIQAAHRPALPTVTLIGYNYFAADRRHPVSVLGMMYALEVIASVYGGAFSSAVRESLLLDGDAGISFINSHATMDAVHMTELRLIMNTVVDAAAHTAIVESALVNFDLITRIFATV